jgi:hypothetical protein
LSKICFEHGPKDESKDQRSTLIIKFSEKIADNSKNKHEEDVKNTVFEAIRANDTKEQDKREKNPVRDLQDLDPEGNEREVKYQKHNIPNIHATDDPPKKIGMIF